MAQHHNYIARTHNNRKLHIIYTPASNIALYNLEGESNLRNSAYYGINGGWFEFGVKPLNISLNDGIIIGPGLAGMDNNFCGGGAIGWNGTNFEVYEDIQSMFDLDIGLRNGTYGTWAQGGYSMYLGSKNWLNMIYSEMHKTIEEAEADKPLQNIIFGPAARTGMVIDKTTKLVYLIVTKDTSTFGEFRKAIQSYLGISDGSSTNTRYAGLFLDGGGSSQLKAKDSSGTVYVDSSRELYEIIKLRDAT